MTGKEIMERAGTTETGRALAYIKDAIEEMAISSETHVKVEKFNLVKDKRFYDLPSDAVKIIDVRCKHHNNDDDKYRSIPRSIYEPVLVDEDGV